MGAFKQKLTKVFDLGGIGLCYKDSKALEVPCQVITKTNDEKIVLYSKEELNERFLEGSKIDISALFQLENKDPRIELYPMFIPR